jgi:hypothetical protein
MTVKRDMRLGLGRADDMFRFAMFAATVIGLLPLALLALGRQVGLGPLGAAVVSGTGLAIGIRLTRWWLSVARRIELNPRVHDDGWMGRRPRHRTTRPNPATEPTARVSSDGSSRE